MSYRRFIAGLPAVALALLAAVTPAAAQTQGVSQPAVPNAAAPTVRRLSADEAVRLAVENNLGIQVTRINPLIEDLNVAAAQAAWQPSLTSTLQQNSTDSPNNSFLSGAQGTTLTSGRFSSNLSLQQTMRWGGTYSIGWDSSRSTTNNTFSNFSPQLASSLALHYEQPLLRGFHTDNQRQQLLVSQKNREIADVQVRQSVAVTSRTVRNAYWDLAFAIASLQVQQQSLDLANESLRDTRSRVEIGTTPPIDIVEAEAEVATREEAVIVAQAEIGTAEDTLRALVLDPKSPDFWTTRIETGELPAFQATTVDVDMAVRSALSRRTDLEQARKTLEANDITIRYLRDQTLPDVSAGFDYGLSGLGGTQFVRGEGFPGPIIGRTGRSYGAVLSDLLGNDFPSWTAQINVSYPIGATAQQASAARARLQYQQSQTQLRNEELQVATQVREVARQLQTNQKRVDTTRVSRELAERRLDAEQRKFAAGTSTNFLVFQAQRDLAQARNNEIRAILDYQRSAVDLETVQDVPLGATGGATGAVAAAR
jgi:HAE1 family hydrophobic/amphiphilic exporter-1